MKAGATLDLLNDAIGRLAATAVDTVTEVQALEKAAENIMAVGAGNGDGKATLGISYSSDNSNAEWLNGFQALGVQGVTTQNLSAMRKAIDTADASNDGKALNTVLALQAIVSMYRINDYADNESLNPTPSLWDYQAVVVNKGQARW